MNLMNTYKRFKYQMVKGEGNYLIDENGKKYLDFLSGIAVNALGYGREDLAQAICETSKELIHSSNLFSNKNQEDLAKLLVDNTDFDKVFFANSGAEANEGAIKLARKYGELNYGEAKNVVITLGDSFHGRTLATITATGQDSFHEHFKPLPEGFVYGKINDLESIEALINEQTCAVLLEPIQGEGGVKVCTEEFLKGVRSLCDKYGALLIFDEVQTGVGRTGSFFCYQKMGVLPDILTSAKALGGGLPLGAILATDKVASAFVPGDHGSTFGGNPVACSAGKVIVENVLSPGFLEEVNKRSAYFLSGLFALKEKYSWVKELRGRGLLLGLEIEGEGASLVEKAYEKGFIINCTKGNVLRFLPPLTIKEEEIDQLIFMLDELFEERGEN